MTTSPRRPLCEQQSNDGGIGVGLDLGLTRASIKVEDNVGGDGFVGRNSGHDGGSREVRPSDKKIRPVEMEPVLGCRQILGSQIGNIGLYRPAPEVIV